MEKRWQIGDRCEVDTNAARIGSGVHDQWASATVTDVRERMVYLDVDGIGSGVAWLTDVRPIVDAELSP